MKVDSSLKMMIEPIWFWVVDRQFYKKDQFNQADLQQHWLEKNEVTETFFCPSRLPRPKQNFLPATEISFRVTLALDDSRTPEKVLGGVLSGERRFTRFTETPRVG